MKHNKLIGALAAVGGVFAMGSAHAIVPVVAAGLAAVAGSALGTAAVHASPPPARPVAVAPTTSTVVMGGPSAAVTEVVPAPRDGYAWQAGHFEMQNGASTFVPGHWVPNDVVVHQP